MSLFLCKPSPNQRCVSVCLFVSATPYTASEILVPRQGLNLDLLQQKHGGTVIATESSREVPRSV